MANAVEIKAVANGNWNKDIYTGITTKSTMYPRAKSYYADPSSSYSHAIGFIFFGELALSETDTVKLHINIDDIEWYNGNTSKPLRFGYYTSKQTIDTVQYDSTRTQFYNISNPSEQQYEFDLDYRAANNGLCFWFEQSPNYSDSAFCEIDNIGRTNYPRLLLTIADATTSNLAIDQLDTDKNITASWSSTNQKHFEFEAVQGNTALYSTSGTTANSAIIPCNTLPAGAITFRIRVGNGFGDNIYWSNWLEVSKTIIKNTPSIPILEPDRLQVRREEPIDVTFIGNNVTSWIYECIQGGITKFTDNGTTARATQIPRNVLANGTVTNRITATYIPVWATNPSDYRTVVKETTFTAYGIPTNPTLTLDASYSTPYPLFKWTNAIEQISYQLKVKDGTTTIADSLEVFGSNAREHKFITALQNHKTYTAELRIKNQYGLWSNAVTATFKVEFAELAQPTFNVYGDSTNASIVINLESVSDANFHFHEIHRREINGAWTKIAKDLELIDEYKDFACGSGIEYEYKIRAVDANTAYTDSVIKPCKVSFNKTILSVPFTETAYIVRYNVKKTIDNIEDKTFVLYSGLNKPKMIQGAMDYKVLSITCAFKNKEEYDQFMAIASNRVLLLRDGKGLKCYGAITGLKDTLEDFIYSNEAFTFTETYYKEGDYLESEQRPLSFADTEW